MKLRVDFVQYMYLVTMAVALLTLWTFKKLRNKRRAKSMPGPRGLPIVGYLPFLGPNLHQIFMELAQIHGPIYKLSICRKKCVVISSPSLVKQVVRDQDTTFANRNPIDAAVAFSFGGNDIGCLPYGPKWRMLRKVIQHELLSTANLNALYPLRRNEVMKIVRKLYDNAGKPIHFGELAFLADIKMVMRMFWGDTIKEDEVIDDVAAKFHAEMSRLNSIMGTPNVSDFYPFLARFDVQGVRRETESIAQTFENIFDFTIDKRRNHGKGGEKKREDQEMEDFLHLLLEFRDKETGNPLSKEQIKALLMDMIAGTDTASKALEWVMTELMLHSQVMKKAQEELFQVVGNDNTVEEFHIHKLPYLQPVLKEALRLHPVAPLLLPRSPSETCIVGGYEIPKGSRLFINVWAIHRDPKFWDQATKFQPERFLGDGVDKWDYRGNNLQYLPFGSGRRICPGYGLGEKMLLYVLATFLHMFNWESPNGANLDNSEKFGMVLQRSTPLIVIPTPRLSN